MEKCKLEKARLTQQMLDELVGKVNALTSGNVSHLMASIRSVTKNLDSVMIDDLINSCEQKDLELKQLLEKLARNIRAIDNILQDLTPTTVDNGKKHVAAWIKFYADALHNTLKTYE